MAQSGVFDPLPPEWSGVLNRSSAVQRFLGSFVSGDSAVQRYAEEHQVLPLLLPQHHSVYARDGENSVRQVRAQHFQPILRRVGEDEYLPVEKHLPERYYVGFETNVEQAAVDLSEMMCLVNQAYRYDLLVNQYRHVTLTMEDGVSWQLSLFSAAHHWLLLGLGAYMGDGDDDVYIIDSEPIRFVVGEHLYDRYDPSDHTVKPVRIKAITAFDERPFKEDVVRDIPIQYLDHEGTIHALHIPDQQAKALGGATFKPFTAFLTEREQDVRIVMDSHRFERERLTPEYQAAELSRAVAESEERVKMAGRSAAYMRALVEALQTTGRMSDIPYLIAHPGANYERYRRMRG